MEHQTPDPETGSSPSGARVEDDFVRPLKPTRDVTHLRLPAALPFAIAGILVVTTVAFGATVFRNVVNPNPSATPIVAGTPTAPVATAPVETAPAGASEAPSVAATEAATPTPGELTISVETLPGKARITWSAYAGSDFAYYKVVRSTDATASWPLDGDDTLVAAIDNVNTLTYLDGCGAGTVTYRVFAVTSAGSGYAILAESPAETVSVAPAVTDAPPPPASNPAELGALSVHDNGDGTFTFSWNAYTGASEFSYYKLDGEVYPKAPGYVENDHYWAALSTSTTSTTIKVEAGTWNVNVEAVNYPGGKAASVAKTSVLKLTVTGTATQTAPPIASLTLTVVAGTSDHYAHLTWSKYTGPYFKYYGIVRSETNPNPTLALGAVPWQYFDNVNTLAYVDTTVKAGHTYHYRVYAFTDATFGANAPACTLGTVLAVSPVIDFTVPVAATPTPTPTRTPTPTPTPTV
jgi:hypothetical protein